MPEKYTDTDKAYVGNALGAGIQTEYDMKYDTINHACRERSQTLLMRRARELHESANKMENLAKLIEFMPKELEEAFYPLVESYLYSKR